MKCPNCKAELKNAPKFCPYCGVNLGKPIEEKKEVKPRAKKKEVKPRKKKQEIRSGKERKGMKWVLLAIIPLAIAAAIFLFLNNKDAAYIAAMENGIESVSSEEYDDALIHFDEALAEKKNDENAKQWSQNTAVLQNADELYSKYEFDQALTKVNNVLAIDNIESDLTALFEKADALKIKIEEIMTAQEAIKTDLQEAQNMFDVADSDEDEIQMIIKKLENILARKEINEEYHTDLKQDTQTLMNDVKAYEEKIVERKAITAEKEKVQALEKEKAKEKELAVKNELSDYSALEIEYARIILMYGYPNGSTIYVSESPAGTAIASPYEETIKYPDKTVALTGNYGADGMIVYSPIGGGYITVYPVPMHWHQDDQSPEGYRKYTQQILDDAERVYIDPGDPVELLKKLRSTEFIKY